MVRVTGMQAMLLSVPWVEELLHTAGAAASQLWSIVTRLTDSNSRDKRDITQDQITEFLEQVSSVLAFSFQTKKYGEQFFFSGSMLKTLVISLSIREVYYLQVMTRIPAAYRTNISSVELCLRLLDTHALHLRLEDLRYSSPLDALARSLQSPLRAVVNTRHWITARFHT